MEILILIAILFGFMAGVILGFLYVVNTEKK